MLITMMSVLVFMSCKQQCLIIMCVFLRLYKCKSFLNHRIVILRFCCPFQTHMGLSGHTDIYLLNDMDSDIVVDRQDIAALKAVFAAPAEEWDHVWPVCLYPTPCAFLSVFASHSGLELHFKKMADANCCHQVWVQIRMKPL